MTKPLATCLFSGCGAEITNGPEGFRIWAYLPTEDLSADKVRVEVSRCLSDEEFRSLAQEWKDHHSTNEDCDIFEIAQELYDFLEQCQIALNYIPNTRIRGCDYKDSYALVSAVTKTLSAYRERI